MSNNHLLNCYSVATLELILELELELELINYQDEGIPATCGLCILLLLGNLSLLNYMSKSMCEIVGEGGLN